jgi:hypothetical protein
MPASLVRVAERVDLRARIAGGVGVVDADVVLPAAPVADRAAAADDAAPSRGLAVRATALTRDSLGFAPFGRFAWRCGFPHLKSEMWGTRLARDWWLLRFLWSLRLAFVVSHISKARCGAPGD